MAAPRVRWQRQSPRCGRWSGACGGQEGAPSENATQVSARGFAAPADAAANLAGRAQVSVGGAGAREWDLDSASSAWRAEGTSVAAQQPRVTLPERGCCWRAPQRLYGGPAQAAAWPMRVLCSSPAADSALQTVFQCVAEASPSQQQPPCRAAAASPRLRSCAHRVRKAGPVVLQPLATSQANVTFICHAIKLPPCNPDRKRRLAAEGAAAALGGGTGAAPNSRALTAATHVHCLWHASVKLSRRHGQPLGGRRCLAAGLQPR